MSNPILPPDHNNYYAFGPAWKDRTNGVTDLSAQTGSGNVDLSRNEAARHAHQSQLLQARLNTLLDVINTPIDTGKASVGGMNLPYVRQPISALRNAPVLPSISRGRPFTGKSFDEFNAGKKLMEEYSRCDPAVREGFLTELVKVFTQNENTRIGDAIGTLLDDLQDMPGGQHQNLGALRKQRVLLQQMQASAESRQGLSRLGARAKLFFGGKDAELRKVEQVQQPTSPASSKI